jgi:hypothetical protein
VKGMLAEIYGDATAELETSKAVGDASCVTSVH